MSGPFDFRFPNNSPNRDRHFAQQELSDSDRFLMRPLRCIFIAVCGHLLNSIIAFIDRRRQPHIRIRHTRKS